MSVDKFEILSSDWSAHELLDSGDRQKLERFGDCVVVRSEPKAWWSPQRPQLWKNADARHLDDDKKNSAWVFSKKISAPVLSCGKIKFCTKFMDGTKHLGVFPEQKPHWDFISQSVKNFSPFVENGKTIQRPRLLNLFGYTGAASLFAAQSGYFVTHVDASKPSVDWARRNQAASGIDENSVRWIVDDALKFVKRQERRAEKFEAIVLDPPAFGRGPKNELWKLDKMLQELLSSCANLLSNKKMFVLITLYSIEASPIMAANVLRQYFDPKNIAFLSAGELVLSPKNGSFDLPLSIWAKLDFMR